MREIHDRAEALRVYCKKHDGLMEAGNRLAGITALCEGRIGQELVRAQEAGEVATRGRPAKNSTASLRPATGAVPLSGGQRLHRRRADGSSGSAD